MFVGRDTAGHWLVQGCKGQLEGRFISQGAAWAFARSECRGVPGAIALAALHPLVPAISFAPLRADEITIAHGA
ncbi:hypothetical protein BWQ93_03010 [Sphingopyxis sp. QXT-31]|uniref:hypothetical protein n=1 Tax=Sphingopyxis sp. QXT-31 TaxID=1357916 RepID=UPI000979658E|nr:hypothetical protein [Sphingopyxis sp. QXT-31]APZ97567.1 hypothetical protein BWQ93_03010 [Sphingopyxis sp. QXT-31]